MSGIVITELNLNFETYTKTQDLFIPTHLGFQNFFLKTVAVYVTFQSADSHLI
jgi:hypothetical protein